MKLLGKTLKIFGIKFANTNLQHRIGHQICEPLFLHFKIKNDKIKRKRFIFLAPEGLANNYLSKTLPKNYIFISNKFISKVLKQIYIFEEFVESVTDMFPGEWPEYSASKFYQYLDAHYSDNVSKIKFLNIPDKTSADVVSLFSGLGISSNDWYVCVHNRSNSYDSDDFKKNTHHRNSNFKNLIPSIKFILDQGGKVVRVGEPDEFSNEKDLGVIHYESSTYRNPKNDVLINSHCSFFIGNTSGLLAIPGSLGTPIVGVNAFPFGACKIWGPEDIAIPKIYQDKISGQIIGFKSISNSPLANNFDSTKFEEANIIPVENSSEEILWAVEEMYEKVFLRGQASLQKTQLQLDFDSLFNETHFTFYSKTLICAKFLEKYKDYIYK